VQELQTGDLELIGPYRVIRRLGMGGMGQVFLGRSPGGRLLAIKVIRAELAADPQFRARFRHELRDRSVFIDEIMGGHFCLGVAQPRERGIGALHAGVVQNDRIDRHAALVVVRRGHHARREFRIR